LTACAPWPTLAAMDPWRRTGGFALAELLVSLAVLALVMAAVSGVLAGGFQAYGWGAARVLAQQGGRIALERMAVELREAGYDPTGAGIQAIVAAAPALVTFQRDLNGNGVVDATRERVTFLLRPGDTVLRRDAGGGAQPIVEDVHRLTLTYLDRAGAPASDPAAIALVHISLEVGRAGSRSVVQTSVALRNARPG
jgi:type II secretory pathway component PulJ